MRKSTGQTIVRRAALGAACLMVYSWACADDANDIPVPPPKVAALPAVQVPGGVHRPDHEHEEPEAPAGAREAFRDLVNWVGEKAGWDIAIADRARRQVRYDAIRFATVSTTLPPEKAAEQWLALYKRWTKLPDELPHVLQTVPPPDEFIDDPSQATTVTADRELTAILVALPGPRSWPELQRLILARPNPKKGTAAWREAGLRVIAATLSGDLKKQKQAVARAMKLVKPVADGEVDETGRVTTNAIRLVMEHVPELADAKWFAAQFERELQRKLTAESEELETPRLDLPNLYAVMPAAKAEELYRKALASRWMLEAPHSTIARQKLYTLATQSVEQMRRPQWSLIPKDSLPHDGMVPLFDAISNRFPPRRSPGPLMRLFGSKPWNTPETEEARRDALASLMMQAMHAGDANRAIALARELQRPDEEPHPGIFNRGREFHAMYSVSVMTSTTLRPRYETVAAVLQDDQTLPLMSVLKSAAQRDGRAAELIQVLQKQEREAQPGSMRRVCTQWRLFEVLAAQGRLDEALTVLRRLVEEPDAAGIDLPGEDEDATLEPRRVMLHTAALRRKSIGLYLARIGDALDRADLVDEGLTLARKEIPANPADDPYEYWLAIAEIAAVASTDPARIGDTITLLQDAEKKYLDFRKGNPAGAEEIDQAGMRLVMQLTICLAQDGRYREAIDAVMKFPAWPTPDLARLGEYSFDLPVQGFCCALARSFHATGRKDESRHIALHALTMRATPHTGVQDWLSSNELLATWADCCGDDPAAALDLLRPYLSGSKPQGVVVAAHADALRRLGRLKEAKDLLVRRFDQETLLDEYPKGRGAIAAVYIEVLTDLKDPSLPAEQWRVSGAAQGAKAWQCDDLGLYSQAEREYRAVAEVYGKAPDMYGVLGTSLLNSYRPTEAVDAYRKGVEALLADKWAKSNIPSTLIELQDQLGKRPEMAELLHRLLKEHPNDTRIAGLAYSYSPSFAPALSTLAETMLKHPEAPVPTGAIYRLTADDLQALPLKSRNALIGRSDSTNDKLMGLTDLTQLWNRPRDTGAQPPSQPGLPVLPCASVRPSFNGEVEMVAIEGTGPGAAAMQTSLMRLARSLIINSKEADEPAAEPEKPTP